MRELFVSAASFGERQSLRETGGVVEVSANSCWPQSLVHYKSPRFQSSERGSEIMTCVEMREFEAKMWTKVRSMTNMKGLKEPCGGSRGNSANLIRLNRKSSLNLLYARQVEEVHRESRRKRTRKIHDPI